MKHHSAQTSSRTSREYLQAPPRSAQRCRPRSCRRSFFSTASYGPVHAARARTHAAAVISMHKSLSAKHRDGPGTHTLSTVTAASARYWCRLREVMRLQEMSRRWPLIESRERGATICVHGPTRHDSPHHRRQSVASDRCTVHKPHGAARHNMAPRLYIAMPLSHHTRGNDARRCGKRGVCCQVLALTV